MGQQSRARDSALDWTTRRLRLHDLVAPPAGQFRPHLPNDFEARRHPFQYLRNVFAQMLQLAATVRTRGLLGHKLPRLARQVCGQRPPHSFLFAIHCGLEQWSGGIGGRLRGLLRFVRFLDDQPQLQFVSICQSSFSDLRPNCIRRSLAISGFSRSISSSSRGQLLVLAKKLVVFRKKLFVFIDDQCVQWLGSKRIEIRKDRTLHVICALIQKLFGTQGKNERKRRKKHQQKVCRWKTFAAHTASCGACVRTGRRQSIPSSNIEPAMRWR